MTNPIYIDRPPRIQPELPFQTIEIPAPPEQGDAGIMRLIQVALPLLTIVGYILVSSMGGRGRGLLMIPMALSVIGSTGFSIYSFLRERRKRAEQEKKYLDQLVEMTKEMRQYHDQQRRFNRYNYPDIASSMRIKENARKEVEKPERTLRSESRLWERRTSDDDFGFIRLGMGTLPSTVIYEFSGNDNTDEPLVRAAKKLQNDSRFVADIPVVLSLRPPQEEPEESEDIDAAKQQRTPFVHALGIAGEKESVYQYVRAMLAHFTIFHAPSDTRLYILATHQAEWAWSEDLPHAPSNDQEQASCFVEQIVETQVVRFGEDGENELEQFLEQLRKELAQRKIRLQEQNENEEQSDPTLPLLLVVIDLLDAGHDKNSLLYAIESKPATSLLVENGASLGAAVIFLVPERSKVPSGCSGIIEIEKTTPATNSKTEQHKRLHFRYSEVGVNSFRYIGEADAVRQQNSMRSLAQDLALLRIRQGAGANLTSSVPFMSLMEFDSMAHLLSEAQKNWSYSIDSQYANYLRVKIGRMSGNKPRTLVFSAKQDGVHGMVAGSTGSGKSELLISLITGLAVNYDPTVVNFVLVDYKGGGAFNDFKDLPHCVDIITNLDGEGVTRMFTAIRAEMNRRSKLNADMRVKDIIEYQKENYHHTHQPYPYLFIIIDEFAEMIAERSEYRSELESITRVGRSLGVTLLLAAQRPSGVTDQMRSNIKFRICLRVETQPESREMLRRIDAALLPGGLPGRGYLQVGNDEIELIQVAYTGEPYINPDSLSKVPVLWPDRLSGKTAMNDAEPPPPLYKAIIDHLQELAADRPRQLAPWPKALPNHLALTQLLVADESATSIPSIMNEDETAQQPISSTNYLSPEELEHIALGRHVGSAITLNPSLTQWREGNCGWVEAMDWHRFALRPVVGLIDNPYERCQLPLTIDFRRGHFVLFGASGWGKTTLIRTLVVSLCSSHSPRHTHIYVLDLGGRNLGLLAEFPHVGEVITPDEAGYEERVEQLIRELGDEVERRKQKINTSRATDIYEYNATHRDDIQPAIVVAIDNFVEFRETFGSERDDVESTMDRFVLLARQSQPYGVHFLITAGQLNTIPNQLFSLFTERMTLKLADTTEYRAIVGGHIGELSDIPGRGYIKIGRQPLSFQIALPIDVSVNKSGIEADELYAPINDREEVEQLAKEMVAYIKETGYQYPEPTPVKALPTGIYYKELLARQHNLTVNDQFLSQVESLVRENWQESKASGESADWLAVTIGVISGNRPRPLQLEAKEDGVHGLIAGGTGSGKSELLTTLVVGLALNYDPSILNFILVDYKGGGAFAPFRDLPHCVDIVTNLRKGDVRRMFTAINAEILRRQKLNADCEVNDIVEYRKKNYHITRKPYPHLFIIIDEYAEMITETPEFRSELESISRVGRSLGVNLILASQRPIGVSDQMRANIKLRICLRVEDVATSREMLRRSDAAYLPSGMPGRGYLQVGNEQIELTQIAYAGEPYGYLIDPDLYPEQAKADERPKFFNMMVQMANNLATELDVLQQRTPWPPPLSQVLTFSTPLLTDYLNEEAIRFIADGSAALADAPVLNRKVEEWLAGKAKWSGVQWDMQGMCPVVGLIDDPHSALQIPLKVNLRRGHAVVFGLPSSGKTTFLRSLVVSMAAIHSPGEFHAHILDLGGRNLESLRNLPHVGTIILPDEQGYEERVQQLLRELKIIVEERKKLFPTAEVTNITQYNKSSMQTGRKLLPAMLVVIDNFDEFLQTFGNQGGADDDENNPLTMLIALARQGNPYGIHLVVSVQRLNVLSSKLYSLFTERLTLRLSDTSEYSGIVGNGAGELDDISGRGLIRENRRPLQFQVALLPGTVDEIGQVSGETAQMRALGTKMHALIEQEQLTYEKPLKIDALPTPSFYRQLLTDLLQLQSEGSFLAQLQEKINERWASHRSAENADWLNVTLGIASGNRPRTLHLEAKRDGVHGMVAGGTGSGKSELLMTLIMGLAVNYSPDILNFVLVDYKGGGAFTPFKNLPHCVDIVTNLNKAGVNRMFTSIKAEIQRRQALNVETGTKDIVDYRKNGYHLAGQDGTPGTPYPHLFIIIDEYTEMIDDNPEFKAELESITRVGRAQGINLLLASQRPKGVTDQMRANIKYRICLRVEERDTSREMLGRPDAAFLPNNMPGRGYVQIGNDNIELIQVSWTGDDQPDDRPVDVVWPDRSVQDSQSTEEQIPKLFDSIVQLASELTSGVMAPKPWPSFLPDTFSLQSRIFDSQHNREFILAEAVSDWLNGDPVALWPGITWQEEAVEAVVGLLDDPVEAAQTGLTFDISASNIVAMGDGGMGKTTFIQTLLVSLFARYSPNELHTYILDLGGRSYHNFESIPHVGAVLYSADESFDERLNRLLELLEQMVRSRQKQFSEANTRNIFTYNASPSNHPLPFILVCIDNFAEMRESYELLVENRLTPIVRRSLGVGIAFVVTCNAPNNMPNKLYTLFSERITLKQTNTDRYLDIVGRGAVEIGDIPGRGYRRMDKRPLLFQIALPVGLPEVRTDQAISINTDELSLLGKMMKHVVESGQFALLNVPNRLQILPSLVSLSELFAQSGEATHRIEPLIGMLYNLEPALIDIKRNGPHFAILGPSRAGKTIALYNWLLSLTQRYSPEQIGIIVIDARAEFVHYGGAHHVAELPHVLATITELDQFKGLVDRLLVEAQRLGDPADKRELFVLIDNYEDLLDEIGSGGDLDLANLARRYGRNGLHFVLAAADSGSGSLKKRVTSSKYGVVLGSDRMNDLGYTGRALLPASQALPVGRGFLVRSGQPTVIQIALPDRAMSDSAMSDSAMSDKEADVVDESFFSEEQREEQLIQNLDHWIERILSIYPSRTDGTQPSVQTDSVSPSQIQNGSHAANGTVRQQQTRKLMRIQRLLRAVMIQDFKAKNKEDDPAVSTTVRFLQMDSAAWNNEEALMEIIKKTYLKLSGEENLPKEIYESDYYQNRTDDNYLQGLEQLVDVNAALINPEENGK